MEVLSVQNQYQGQFGVIGSSKVKDWTSPLTPPPPPPLPQHSSSQLQSASNSISSEDNVAYKQRYSNSHRRESVPQSAEDEEQHLELYTEDAIEGGDVVDGGNWSAPQKQTQQLQQHYNHYIDHQHEQRQQHFYYNNHHYGSTHHTYNNYHQQNQHHANNYHHYQQEQQLQYKNHQLQYIEQQRPATAKQQKSQQAHSATTATTIIKQQPMEATYNNNMFYYEPPVGAAITPTGTPTSGSCFGSATTDVDIAAVNELAHRVQTELRDAKKRHLDCTEVSLPFDLMPRIAAEIIKASEREPCGVRGCSLYIDFECEPGNVRRIASFKVDDCTVSTFELYLTLKQDKSGWTSLLPQFIKNLTRSNTILISPDFTLTKNKLYSCD